MSNRGLKIQWAIETMETLSGRIGGVDSFNLWKAKRDEKVAEERRQKAKADANAAFERARQAYEKQKTTVTISAGNGGNVSLTPAPVLTYVVHGYTAVENGSILAAPVPHVTLLYAGSDEDHAQEIAIGCSRGQKDLTVGMKLYDWTSVSACKNGFPYGPAVRY